MTANSGPSPVRRLMFSGTWYDRDPAALSRQVDAWRSTVAPLEGRVCALVAPHAGLRYSGRIAAWSYEPLTGLALDAVVLIGPSHYAAFPGCAMLRRGSLATPWGDLPVHAALADALAGETHVLAHERREIHAAEHALELHLPLLARVQPGVAVVPILVGEHSRAVARTPSATHWPARRPVAGSCMPPAATCRTSTRAPRRGGSTTWCYAPSTGAMTKG